MARPAGALVRRAFAVAHACSAVVRKSWRWSLIALAGAAVGAAMLSAPEESGSAGSSSSAGTSSGAGTSGRTATSGSAAEPSWRARVDRGARSSPPLALPQRPGIGGSRADLFAPPAPPPPPPPARASPQDAAPSAPPPNPYRFAGTARIGERLMILLARGDALVEAKEGETLDDLYKVRSASLEGVALVYAPLGIEQLVAAMPAPEPAPR